MLKKLNNRPLLSSLFGTVTALLGAVAVVGCSSEESPGVCTSADGLWQFPNCSDTSNYDYVGPAGVPCTTPDQLWTYTSCMVPGTGTYHGDCATTDSSWRLRVCSDPDTAYWVGAGPAPTTSAPPLTGQNPPVGVNPVAPVNPAVTPGGTVSPVVPTDTTMPVTPVAPAGTTTDPTTPVNPDTTVTPDTAAVTPDTTVTPTTTDTPDTSDSVDPVDPVSPGGADPAGYWRQNDWHGCVWTGIDDLNVGTTIAPQEFLTGPNEDGSYCVSGKVGPSAGWEGVSLLGFNLAEPAEGADCSYKPEAATAEGPPGVLLQETGIAINFANIEATTLRIQLQGPDGASDAAQRWCQTISLPQGPAFLEYADFHNQCWVTDGEYNAEQPANAFNPATDTVSAIVFTVPGDGWDAATGDPSDGEDVPFEYCINGFAAGNSEADAPVGGVVAEQTGFVGQGGDDYDRAAVVVDGEKYIIQNNNWGNEAGELVLEYTNNSFMVVQGSGNGGNAPASFPSIFIGANGFTEQGAFSTTGTDNLPIQIGNITSIPTTFRWSGSTSEFNATYDVWFASQDPNGQRYNDGLNGFLMVWLKRPGGKYPIGWNGGSPTATAQGLGGKNWDIFVGPRNEGGASPDGGEGELVPQANAPVVSYLVQGGDTNALTFDLKDFIDDAVNRGYLSGSLYLTDVFAGFEIWSGGAGGNLAVDEFTCKVNP